MGIGDGMIILRNLYAIFIKKLDPLAKRDIVLSILLVSVLFGLFVAVGWYAVGV